MLKDEMHNYIDGDTESVEAQASQGGNKDSQNRQNQNNKDNNQKQRKNSNNDGETDKQKQQDKSKKIKSKVSETSKGISAAMSILKEQDDEKVNQFIMGLNQRLNLMSQMPNNNIGLALIFRRFLIMNLDQQKQLCFNIFHEYDKHFVNVITQIQTFSSQLDVALSQEKLPTQEEDSQSQTASSTTATTNQAQSEQNPQSDVQKEQLQAHIKALSDQVLQLVDLLRLTKRIAYDCPVEHISDPFFMLYTQYKSKIKDIEQDILDRYINDQKGNRISDHQIKQEDKGEQSSKEAEKQEEEDPQRILRMEYNVLTLSPYLYFNLEENDENNELPIISQLPLQLLPNQYFNPNPQFQQQLPQYQYSVERVNKGIDLSKVRDEFANGQEVNLNAIMSRIFLIDGRIYKHYHLLPWFPKYMEMFYQSQLLLMDNNDGDEQKENQSENNLFNTYVNYYLAIMAVSCYSCEYLLYILQEQFLLEGGPLEWLVFGLDRVDPKLRRIAELNEVLAFQPWSINKDHLHFLINGGQNQNENWTVHEVLKASTILATYHGLCGLCHGMGLIPDIDIVQELLGLMGPQALELISKEQLAQNCATFQEKETKKKSISRFYELNAMDCDADVSSCTSRSQKSEGNRNCQQSERIFNILQKRQSKKKEQQDYSSDSAEESDKKQIHGGDDDSQDHGYEPEYGLTENEQVEAFRQDIEQLNIDDDDDVYDLDPQKDMGIGLIKNGSGKGKQKSQQQDSQSNSNKLIKHSTEEVKISNDLNDGKETQVPKRDISEIFDKHRIMKITEYKGFKLPEKIKGGDTGKQGNQSNKKPSGDKFLDTFEFNWNHHGYDIFRKYLPLATKLITNQMNMAFNMTKQKFANKTDKVDTSDFRNAIIYYLKEIHGIRCDEFKYKKINELFQREQKIYIKKLMCNPQDITIEDYKQFSELLYDSEKCHVCILAMETKRQVSMVFVARALQDLMIQ